jgi:predicted Zn-dependent protease
VGRQGSKDPKALEYAEQALRLAPENPAIIDTVGTIQIERGEIDAGLANLRRAVSIGPDLLPLQLNLAKALVKAGRKDEARTQLDTLLPRLKEGTPLHRRRARCKRASEPAGHPWSAEVAAACSLCDKEA